MAAPGRPRFRERLFQEFGLGGVLRARKDAIYLFWKSYRRNSGVKNLARLVLRRIVDNAILLDATGQRASSAPN